MHHHWLNNSAVASLGAVAAYADTSSCNRRWASSQLGGAPFDAPLMKMLERLDSEVAAERPPELDALAVAAALEPELDLVPVLMGDDRVDASERRQCHAERLGFLVMTARASIATAEA